MTDLAYAQATGDGGPSPLVPTLFLFLPLFLVMYFLILRPQQQKVKAHREMVENLKRNDEVITGGGIYGRVIELGEKAVTLEIAPNVRVRVDRQHIESVTGGGKPAKTGGAEKGEGKDK